MGGQGHLSPKKLINEASLTNVVTLYIIYTRSE